MRDKREAPRRVSRGGMVAGDPLAGAGAASLASEPSVALCSPALAGGWAAAAPAALASAVAIATVAQAAAMIMTRNNFFMSMVFGVLVE